jgi:uncharacterized protein
MKFSERFGEKAFLPVIHVEANSYGKMVENVNIAMGEGADGVFLISHDGDMRDNDLLDDYDCLKRRMSAISKPDFWIGVNCLRMGKIYPATIFTQISHNTNGVWIDSIDNGFKKPDENAEEMLAARTRIRWEGLLFGGVAFKYQAHVPLVHLPRASQRAMKYVDVVTTSGDATSHPPELEKIRIMKEAIGDFPLAIASGMTPENVHQYLPYVDAFLVASSIGKTFTELDPNRVRQMRKAIPI